MNGLVNIWEEEVGLEVSVTQSGTSLRCNVGKKTERNASDQEKCLRRLQSGLLSNLLQSGVFAMDFIVFSSQATFFCQFLDSFCCNFDSWKLTDVTIFDIFVSD